MNMMLRITDNIIRKIINLLPSLNTIRIILGIGCWINDGFYTGRSIAQMITGHYQYGFWGTVMFLIFTLGTFISIFCTHYIIWQNLSITWKNIIGLEFLANLLFITYRMPWDLLSCPSLALAHWYSIIDVSLITYCIIYIKKGCYDSR